MPASFYSALVQQAERTLRYCLDRHAYARKYETPAHAAKWAFRVVEASRKLDEARDAAALTVQAVAS